MKKINIGTDWVHVIEIDSNEVGKILFDHCEEPKETLTNYYERHKDNPPDLLINGGLFGMSGGIPCFGYIHNGVTVANDGLRVWGIGTKDGRTLSYGHISDGFKEWLSGYPVLVKNGEKVPVSDANELNYKARRSAIGYKPNGNIIVVAVDKPGMTFPELASVFISVGASYAINLDGGGSTRLYVNGDLKTEWVPNRAVDNVISIWLKKEPVTNEKRLYYIMAGAVSWADALDLQEKIRATEDIIGANLKGCYIVKPDPKKNAWAVQIGIYSKRTNARRVQDYLKKKGINVYILNK